MICWPHSKTKDFPTLLSSPPKKDWSILLIRYGENMRDSTVESAKLIAKSAMLAATHLFLWKARVILRLADLLWILQGWLMFPWCTLGSWGALFLFPFLLILILVHFDVDVGFGGSGLDLAPLLGNLTAPPPLAFPFTFSTSAPPACNPSSKMFFVQHLFVCEIFCC